MLNNFNPDWTRLTHLKVGAFFASRDIPPTGAGLGLPTVQHLEYLHDGPGFLQGQGWWLPALRTLKIGLVNNAEDFAVLITVLESVGSNLTLLEIIRTYPPPPLSVLATLWHACPRLETLAANFWGLSFEESPPLNSPFRHLIDTGQSMENCVRAVKSIAEQYWLPLNQITVPTLSWAGELPLQILQQAPGGKVMMELSVDLSRRGVRLEDRMGRTLYETDTQGEFWRYASRRGKLYNLHGLICSLLSLPRRSYVPSVLVKVCTHLNTRDHWPSRHLRAATRLSTGVPSKSVLVTAETC